MERAPKGWLWFELIIYSLCAANAAWELTRPDNKVVTVETTTSVETEEVEAEPVESVVEE